MTKEEALKATLAYVVPGDWELENLDLSDENFVWAMRTAGLVYKDKNGNIQKRNNSNGIFQANLKGVPFKGIKESEWETFVNLSFSVMVMADKNFQVVKIEGDEAATVYDNETIVGFCSPCRDTRAHWCDIPGDTRPIMMSFTTQMPGSTDMLQHVWEKGISRKNADLKDFFHGETSQRILSSRVVEACNKELLKATKPQWIKMDLNCIQNWTRAEFHTEENIDGHHIVLKKEAGQRSGKVYVDEVYIGEAKEFVTKIFAHYTNVRIDQSEETKAKIDSLEGLAVKHLLEWVYDKMIRGVSKPALKKGKKLETTIKSFADIKVNA